MTSLFLFTQPSVIPVYVLNNAPSNTFGRCGLEHTVGENADVIREGYRKPVLSDCPPRCPDF